MAYTLTNLRDDIRNYTEVSSSVLTDAVLDTIIKNAENKIYRAIDTDQSVFYATSNAIVGNRYVTIPDDLRAIRYVQFKDSSWKSILFRTKRYIYIAEYYSTPGTSAVDIPKYYANWDEEFWVLAPTPDKTYEITLAYDKEPETDYRYNFYTRSSYSWALIYQINIKIYFCTHVW